MERYTLPSVAGCAFVPTDVGLTNSGHTPRAGDGALLLMFVSGVVFGVLACVVWRLRAE